MSATNSREFSDLGTLFDEHIRREFADHDVDATMETMVPEPYVYNVPSMVGGLGSQGVRRFYSEHFINQIPKNAQVTSISRAIARTLGMNERLRQVLQLSTVEDLDAKEIAQVLGLSLTAAKSRLFRARARTAQKDGEARRFAICLAYSELATRRVNETTTLEPGFVLQERIADPEVRNRDLQMRAHLGLSQVVHRSVSSATLRRRRNHQLS